MSDELPRTKTSKSFKTNEEHQTPRVKLQKMTPRFNPDQPEKSIDELEAELAPAFDKFSDKFKQRFAKLEDRQIIPCTLTEWTKWDPDHEKRVIGRHETETHLVSTVFLGLDYAHFGNVRCDWFETMIFDKTQRHELELDGKLTGEWTIGESVYKERYSTLEEAEQGHRTAIAWLEQGTRQGE
jgi:hypothetical protein